MQFIKGGKKNLGSIGNLMLTKSDPEEGYQAMDPDNLNIAPIEFNPGITTDIELEKSFIFLKFLNKKLPKREIGKLDISDTIDLDSLRIQKIHEKNYGLTPEDTVLDPPKFEGGGVVEPEYDFLSEIINQINNVYGVNLTDEDKIDLSRLKKRLMDNPEIEKYMTGENTDDNKQNYFKEQFEGMIVDYVNERFEFYKKMEDNPQMKNLIFQRLYKDYQEPGSPDHSEAS